MDQLSQAERDNAANYLAKTKNEVIVFIRDFKHEQLEFKPDFQRWTIAEILHHIAIVDGVVLGMEKTPRMPDRME